MGCFRVVIERNHTVMPGVERQNSFVEVVVFQWHFVFWIDHSSGYKVLREINPDRCESALGAYLIIKTCKVEG